MTRAGRAAAALAFLLLGATACGAQPVVDPVSHAGPPIVMTTGRSGVTASGAPPVAAQAAAPAEPVIEEPPAPAPEPAPAPVVKDVAPVATSRLTIPSLGWSEQVVEEVAFSEGAVLSPHGRSLAVVTGLPTPWSKGVLYLVHAGGADENPGNALSTRDGGSTTPVGTEAVLPDGSPAVVTYSAVSPKASLPPELWEALEQGRSVLVSCRPEEGRDSSSSNIVTIFSRTA